MSADSQRNPDIHPSVIVISSHVVRGSVGNRAAVFALETLGFPVWAVPTVVLPWHPGHSRATRIVPPAADFSALIDDLCSSPWLGEVGGVLSGYLGDAGQAADVARLVGAVRNANPDALYMCDPVIGDTGGLYVPEAVATAIASKLVPIADIATPNVHELAWLSGAPIGDSGSMTAAAETLGPARVLVTSALAMMAGSTGNLLVSGGQSVMAEHRLIPNAPNGLGDLMSATFLARLLEGVPEEKALQMATGSGVRNSCPDFAAWRRRADARDGRAEPQDPDGHGQHAQGDVDGRPQEAVSGISRSETVLVGVDGCKAGWIAVILKPGETRPQVQIHERFSNLVDEAGPSATIAVDMPIGLPDRIQGSGRGPEQAIRPFLGARQSSVFSIPARAAVEAKTYGDACLLAMQCSDPAKKVSKQAFYLFGKIREIDRLLQLNSGLRDRVIECHPEFAFCRLNNMTPMATPKKIRGAVNPDGIAERVDLLARHGIDRGIFAAGPPRGAAMDDLVDASVNLVMAGRHAQGLTSPFPAEPVRDRHGILIAIHG
jgi:pyridoxine kinase